MTNDRRMKTVTVIILTYNSISKLGKLFDKVIQSVLTQDYPYVDLVVVDNGSTDRTADHVRKICRTLSRCKVLELSKNHGWPGGNNRGVLFSKPKGYILFMNDDIILEPSCISKLVDSLKSDEKLAAVQPLIIERGTTIYGFGLGLSGLAKPITRLYDSDKKIFFVYGAALLTRADTFFHVGMFDEDLFLYYDEADYCWRLRLAGYKVSCVKTAKAYHYGGIFYGKDSPIRLYLSARNSIWVLAKNSSMLWLLPRLLLALIELLKGFFNYILLKRDVKRAIAVFKGIVDGFKGLRIAFKKRADIAKIRRISDKEVNKAMNALIDINFIIPYSLRKLLHLRVELE